MFGFNMIPAFSRPFNTEYQCYSVSMLPGNERQDVERGGKIIMPPSALDHLTRLNIVYPMLFKLTNKKTDRVTHCGVLEFIAEEGKVYLPYWMMHNLLLEEGDLLNIESVSLPVATFSKFQPQSTDFLDITNPKAVLENALRSFACLTTGDVIAIKYNKHIYELCVLETKPGSAVSIIECDMNVDFAPPLGYKDPSESKAEKDSASASTSVEPMITEPAGFVPFAGLGNRLDGKQPKKENINGQANASTSGTPPSGEIVRGIPDLNYKIGTIRFIRNSRPLTSDNKEPTPDSFQPFGGEGHQLSKPRGT